MRAKVPREEDRGDRKVFGARAARHDGDVHPGKITCPAPRGQMVTLQSVPDGCSIHGAVTERASRSR
jgi:hypothetical protein